MSNSDDLEKYENITYSSLIEDRSLKSIPHLKLDEGLKGGLSFDKIQNQFQKFSGKLPQYPTYKVFSGILSKKYSLDSSLIEDSSSKETENRNNKIKLFGNHLSLELLELHHADALTIGNRIFLSPDKMDLSSDRGKALVVHEITHLAQQERDPNAGKDAETIMSSKHSEMEKEAQDAERDFLKLSINRKLHKGKKFSYDEHSYNNMGGFRLDNERDSIVDKADQLSLVHPNIAKIFKQMMKEDFSSLTNGGSQTIYDNTNNGTPLSNTADQSSSAKEFKTEQVFLASEGRSVYPPAAAPLSDLSSNITTPSSNRTKDLLDLNSLAEQVYELMSRRLVMERSRRGMR